MIIVECRWCHRCRSSQHRRHHRRRHYHLRRRRRYRHRRCSWQWLHYVPAVQRCPMRTGCTCTLRTFRPLVRSISSAVATRAVPPPGNTRFESSVPYSDLSLSLPHRRSPQCRLDFRFDYTRLDFANWTSKYPNPGNEGQVSRIITEGWLPVTGSAQCFDGISTSRASDVRRRSFFLGSARLTLSRSLISAYQSLSRPPSRCSSIRLLT